MLENTEILNLHSNRRQTRGSEMSDVKKCPKCGGEMEKGTLFGDSKVFSGMVSVKFTNKFSTSILLVWKRNMQ